MPKPQFSDQDVENLARLISRSEGAMGGQAGWDFLHSNARTRYRTYARAILRAGYRLPTERKSMHSRLDEVMVRVAVLEAGFAALVTEIEADALVAEANVAEAVASVEVDADPRGARTMKVPLGPRLPKVCEVPDCGCSGLAHP